MPNLQPAPARTRRVVVASLIVFLALLGVACSDDGGGDEKASDTATQQPADETSMTIWAPSDLKTPVDRVVTRYRQSRPDKQVEVVYGNAEELNDRLLQGERPDIYIGTERQIETLTGEGTLPDVTSLFGTDEVQIVVAPGNPKSITDLTVFGLDPTTTSGLCAADTTCGKSARSALASAKINPTPDSNEPDARSLMSKIANGQLDAGLLSRTQITKAVRDGLVSAVPLPTANRVPNAYEMVAVTGGGVVDDFLRYVRRSSSIKKILVNAGLAEATEATTTTTTQQP